MPGFKNRVGLIVLCIVLLFGLSVNAKNRETVVADGAAAITENDLVRARNMAIDDALRNAVEKAMGTMVDSKTRVENYQTIEDSILLQAQGYIADYKVIKRWIEQSTYFIKVEATVVKKLLKDDLAALELTIKRANDPRVMVIIPEEHISRSLPDPAAETEIIRQMLNANFRLIDQSQVARARNSEIFRRAMSGDTAAYQVLSNQYNADILVLGEAFSERVSQYEGFITCRARVEVRVVRSDTGEILAAHGVHESGVDILESTASKKSLANAGATMAEYLIETIPKQLIDQKRSIQLTISGINFTDLNAIERLLRDIHMVDNVYVRDFSGGYARMDVDTSLAPMDLATEISQSELNLEIMGLSGSKIELKKK